MSTFEQIQRKSGASSTRAASTSHRPWPSRSLAPASVPLAGQVTPDEYMQPTPGTRLQYSLAHIPIFPPEKEDQAGLPARLKAAIERLAGLSMDDVRVHYNSSQPAQVEALAYTRGTDIHLAPGQAHHLAHEAWHVVQQKQGRVQPTLRAKEVALNDDQTLEQEADVMGNKVASGDARADRHASPAEEAREQSALSLSNTPTTGSHRASSSHMAPQAKASMPGSPVIQRTHTKRKQTTASKSKSSKKTKQEQELTAVTEAPVEQLPQPLQVEAHPLNAPVPEPQSLPAPQIGPDTAIAQSQGPQFTTALTTQGTQPYQPMEIATIPQPQHFPAVAEQSANPVPTVKPLSGELRKELENASKTGDSGDRQKALEKLSKDIQDQKIVKLNLESSDPKNPPIQLKIRYSTAKGARDKLALTKYKASGKGKKRKKQAEAEITITVYSGLFAQPPEAIYSTLYHEFIHAAQRTAETDDPTQSTDEYMYEPQEPTKFERDNIISPLQEIETHTWEIERADETGIASPSAEKYYQETWFYLIKYTSALHGVILQGHDKLPFWKGYIKRAVDLLKRLLNSTNPRIKDDLQENYANTKKTSDTNGKLLTEFLKEIEQGYEKIPEKKNIPQSSSDSKEEENQ